MTIAEQLALEVELAGGILELKGDGRISYEIPRGAEHLLSLLREHKQEVIALLQQQQSWEAKHGSDAERMARYANLCRWGAAGESSTTMTDGTGETVFPHCPKCSAYCLHREGSAGPYECLRCGLTEILEADARKAGGARQEAHA